MQIGGGCKLLTTEKEHTSFSVFWIRIRMDLTEIAYWIRICILNADLDPGLKIEYKVENNGCKM